MATRIPTTLYHYCSIESFYHIALSKSIWLCNSSQMNDAHENIWIENYFPIVKQQFAGAKYRSLLKDSFNMFKWNTDPPYIFCLSAVKDLLSQWRAYSQDGEGVAIGFSTKSLKMENEVPGRNVYAEKTFGLLKVEYKGNKQKKKVVDLCEAVKVQFDSKVKDKKIYASMDLAFTLVDWSMIFKNPGFNEEKEWRIVHTPLGHSYDVPLDRLSELKFRLNRGRILTYFDYHFGDDFNSNLIKEIVLGPRCKMTEHEVRQFLTSNGLINTRITVSKSSYR